VTKFRLTTPAPGVTTDIGPAHFRAGVAEVDDTTVGVPGVLAYCRQNGYGVTDLDAEAAALVTAMADPATDGVEDNDNNPITPPPGNAKVEVWRAHVLAIGKDRVTEDQVASLNRDQLKELAAQLGQEGPTS
jgi:hypothetical protein